MASVTLTDLWLHSAADHSDFVRLAQNAEAEVYDQPVEVRRYANGRLRSVTRPGTQQTLTFTLPLVSRSDYDELLSRVGSLQLLRDQRGRILWGIIGEVDGDEDIFADRVQSVSFTFRQVTHSEVV